MRYEEKDWTQPVDPNAIVDEALRGGQIKKNTSDVATATLPITDVSGLGETIRIEVVLDSTRAVPGGELRGTVYVGSGQAQPQMGWVLNLPKGLDYVAGSAPDASFEAKTGELTWRLSLDESGLATLPFVLRVLPHVKREALRLSVKPLAQGNDKRTYQIGKPAKLRVADADASADLDSKGGKLSVDGGRVVLDFGAGALKENRKFVASVFKTDLGKKAERADDTQGTAEDAAPLTFEVTPDTTFETPIHVTIDLAGLIPADLLAKGMVPELRYLRAGEADVEQTDARGEKRNVKARGVTHETMPGHWDPITQKLAVALSHFSPYAIGFAVPKGAPEPWKLGANLGDVSLFRGSMNWSLPIAVPGFPTGAPGLSIAYSSAGADSGAGRMESSDYRLGWGWDLNGVPHIQQGVKAVNTSHQNNGSYNDSWFNVAWDEHFRLSLGGRDYNLVKKSTIDGADEYVPEDYAPVRAVRCKTGAACNGWQLNIPAWTEPTMTGLWGGCAGNANVPVTPAEQHYWQVWTADGTRYVFGTDASSTQHMHDRDGNGSSGKITYQKWYLTRIADPVRDGLTGTKWSADYTYVEDAREGANGAEPSQAAPEFTCVSRGADWEVRTRLTGVSYGNSQSATPRPYQVSLHYADAWQATWKRLDHILVQSNNTKLRKYVFGYGGLPWDERLSSITEQGWNGSTWVQLPATTFEYTSNTDYGHNLYGMISRINNGYGGKVEHEYYWWIAPVNYKSFNTVSFRRFIDGLGNTTQEQYEFVDGTQCYNDTSSVCYFGRDALFPEGRNGIMGFGQVWKTVSPLGGSAQSVIKVTQHITKTSLGKPSYVRNYNAAKTSVLSTQVNHYGLNQPAPGQPAGTWQTWLRKQDEFPLGDTNYGSGETLAGSAFVKRTETDVDGLGNPTQIREYGYYNLIGDERTTNMGYAQPNWTNWIVGKLGYENRYTGVNGQSPLAFKTQTILYYDGHANWNDTLGLGQLTKAGRGNNQAGGSNWAVQDFAYDGAGNLNWIKDPRGFISSAYYDDATLKPLFNDSPLWLGYSYARTYYHYFGRNGVGHPGGQAWGEYHYTTDVNNQMVNRVWYDPYGRVTSVVQPLDSDGEPTQKYVYGDAGQSSVTPPLKIETQQRENCNGCYISTLNFYDGLGRVVQTRVEAPNSKQRVTNLTYDALSRALRQYVPAEENATTSYSRPSGWDSRPNTLTSYDLLGRTTQVTGPDGTNTYLYYGNSNNRSLVRSVDARLNTRVQASNGLGSLVAVEEYTAPCGAYNDCNAAGSPNTTSYTYDAVYGLTNVSDAAGNPTTINYDWLGRKKNMTDPDMGYWTYAYDANGNLTSQTDAKNQTISFSYDVLNRMTWRGVNGVGINSYFYDQRWDGAAQANAIGRRTGGNTWDNGAWQNHTDVIYDARGRVTQSWNNTGAGAFLTQYVYDSADRQTSITYPGGSNWEAGEKVTTHYDAAGQPSSLQSTWGTKADNSTWLVNSASYNALGQPTVFNFNNARSQRWYYYGSNLSAPYVKSNGNVNWNYGKLRQNCVVDSSLGECWDWTVRPNPNTKNAQLNLYYNYDDAGNVNEVTDMNYGGAYTQHLYDYDALDRLKTWKMSNVVQQSYAYDVIGNLTSKTGLGNLTYLDPAHKHAATHLNGSAFYAYDANGNMTIRNDNGTYYQNWNADNKLVSVSGPPGTLTIAYDADGVRVKSVINGVTTVHVGNHYEKNVNTGETTQYFYFGGQRVAMRKYSGSPTNTSVSWLHSDHLGSASLAMNSTGNTVANSSQRYKPFGELRVAGSGQPSKFTFTGHYDFMAFGLIDMKARMYVPVLGRFTSPDTIYDGGLKDPQGLNRYSYVKGHVMSANDPTGHQCSATSTPTPGSSSYCGGGGGGSGSSTSGASSSGYSSPSQPIPPSRQLPAAGQSSASAPYKGGGPANLPAGSVRWTQSSASDSFGPEGKFAKQPLKDVAGKIQSGEVPADTLRVKVFQKTPEMDNWPTTTHPKGYKGDFRNLENGQVYAINNRSLTVQTLAKTDPIPVRWASQSDIVKYSYEYSTPNVGTSIVMQESGTVVSLAGLP